MITFETLEKWLNTPPETERLEFKEAKQQFTLRGVEGFDTTKLQEAIAILPSPTAIFQRRAIVNKTQTCAEIIDN